MNKVSGKMMSRLLQKLDLPIAFASTFFLHLLGVGINMAILGKVTGEMLVFVGCTIGKGGMLTVVLLVRAGHY